MNHKEYDIFSITIDVDWAPDFTIDAVADILIENKVKCTWFITHQSPAIQRLLSNTELFECGIHPNFLPNSTHGKTIDEILDYVVAIVPDSKTVRTHALIQSPEILSRTNIKYGIKTDVTLFLRETPGLQPHIIHFQENTPGLLRIPYFWEDDTETINPEKSWDINNKKYHQKGLKIMNFHPMYIYLNCDTMHGYEILKKIKPIYDLSPEEMEPYVNKDSGAGSFFHELLKYICQNQGSSQTISELAEDWLSIQ